MELDALISNIGSFTNEAIVVADVDPSDGAVMPIKWVNTAFTDLTGYTDAGVQGRTTGMLTGEATDPGDYASVITRLQAWQTFEAELRLYRANGESFWAALTFRLIRDQDGARRFWVMLLHDISARKQAENVLTDLSLIARATGDMVFVLDRQRRIDWANDSFVSKTGYSLADVRGKRVGEVLKAETADQTRVSEMVARLDQRLPHKVDILSRRKDGSRFIGEYEFQPTYDDNGHFTKYVLLVRDITTRVTLEKRYKGVFDETNAAISIKSDGRYLMVNRQFAELFERPHQDFGGAPSDLLGGTPLDLALREAEEQVLKTGESRVWETQTADQGGNPKHLLTKTFRSFDEVLDSHTVCSVATDITKIRQAESALSLEQEKAARAQKRLWSAIEGIPDGFVLYDRQDRVVHANAAFRKMHGQIGGQIRTGTTFEAILRDGLAAGLWNTGEQSDDAWLADQLAARNAGHMAQGCFLGLKGGGWMLAKEIRLDNGERAGIRIDATDIKRTEAALITAQKDAEKAEARLLAAISALENAFTIYDSEDRLVISNVEHSSKLYQQNHGVTFSEIVRSAVDRGLVKLPDGMTGEAWIAKRLHQHANPGDPFEQTLTDGSTYRMIERKTDHGDTVTIRVDLTHEKAQQARLESYARDLETSKRQLEGQNAKLETARRSLEHASLHDSLTGLPNRRYLEQEFARRSNGPAADQLVVLHLDLDRFKQINDAFGHAAGDHVLTRVAQTLRNGIGKGDFCARVGGDEFVVLCDLMGDPSTASRLASRLVTSFRKPVTYENVECRFGASIGIAYNNDETLHASPEQLLINADIALYRAKCHGRNRWAVFSETLQSEVLTSKRLSDDILRALDKGEFTTVYQPQVRADDFTFCGVEALLRWNHPERGMIHPNSFMDTARDLRVIAQLDQMVFAQVVADDAFWRANGQTVPHIAVNVSSERLRSPGFMPDITASGLDPARLSVELLETIFLDEEDDILSWTIDQLREMGVSVEMDDFGTGHSSIIGLLKLKPRRVKIDKSFIDQMLGAREAEALLRSIIDIGRNLEVEVVAEGIETLPQAEMLREMGCDILQGHVFAEAMSAADILDFTRNALPLAAQRQN